MLGSKSRSTTAPAPGDAGAKGGPTKRDRPLSTYFVSPCNELACSLNDYLELEGDTPLDQPQSSDDDDEDDQEDHDEVSASPLMSQRRPFRNISNFVNSFDFPRVRSKITAPGRILSRSVTLVTKTSSNTPMSTLRDHNCTGFDGGSTRMKARKPLAVLNGPRASSSNIGNTLADKSRTEPLATARAVVSGKRDDIVVDENDESEIDDFFGESDRDDVYMCRADDFRTNSTNEMGSPSLKVRPPANLRRFHSMCQTSKEKETFFFEDNSHLKNSRIKHFKVDNDLMPRIDENELYKILCGKYNGDFDEFVVVDCRFKYEFDGGHIKNAVNISSQKDLEEKFIQSELEETLKKKQLLIFHCEFSVYRGPSMAAHLRKCDRVLNRESYPRLSYPDIVILEGGYKNFYEKYKNFCDPEAYVEMKDDNHKVLCEAEMDKVRQENKITRTKSYNQFSPLSIYNSHTRSQSVTMITSHAENSKILKRKKSSSQMKLNSYKSNSMDLRLFRASSISNSLSVFDDAPLNSPKLGEAFELDDGLRPPSALFKMDGHSKLYGSQTSNSSISSINSMSMYSDQVSEFSSTDSLTDPYSSATDEGLDYFDSRSHIRNSSRGSNISLASKPSSSKKLLLNPTSRKPSAPVPQLPQVAPNGTNISPGMSPRLRISTFKFPLTSVVSNRYGRSGLSVSLTPKADSGNDVPVAETVKNSPLLVSSPLSTETPMSMYAFSNTAFDEETIHLEDGRSDPFFDIDKNPSDRKGLGIDDNLLGFPDVSNTNTDDENETTIVD